MIYGTPTIVTNGLVLNLDAANTKSYVSGSTNWFSLGNPSLSGSLINGPAFNNTNGGYIVFDGVNDYVPIASLPALGTNHSLSFWMRIISITAAETQIFMPAGDVASISITNSRIGSWNGTTYRQSSTTMPTGVWFNFVMTCNGSTTIFYLNGNVDLISATTGNFQAGTGYLCSVGPAIARYLNANIGNVAFYDRALSQQEITQNYNALKSRYGLS